MERSGQPGSVCLPFQTPSLLLHAECLATGILFPSNASHVKTGAFIPSSHYCPVLSYPTAPPQTYKYTHTDTYTHSHLQPHTHHTRTHLPTTTPAHTCPLFFFHNFLNVIFTKCDDRSKPTNNSVIFSILHVTAAKNVLRVFD